MKIISWVLIFNLVVPFFLFALLNIVFFKRTGNVFYSFWFGEKLALSKNEKILLFGGLLFLVLDIVAIVIKVTT